MLREQPAKRAACQHFFFLKKVCLMYVSIAFLAPGELLLSCLAGFLTQPFSESGLPILPDSGMEIAFFFNMALQ